jgi:HNH endonuclease
MTEHPARRNYQRLGPDDCWPWLGRLDYRGYGLIGGGKNRQRSHRAAYEDQIGPIPTGLWVLHRCDNPACCNGAHLFLGTNLDNIQDKLAKQRQATWAVMPQAKLDADQVRAIRVDQRPHREIARDYEISRPNISRLKAGLRYRSVE